MSTWSLHACPPTTLPTSTPSPRWCQEGVSPTPQVRSSQVLPPLPWLLVLLSSVSRPVLSDLLGCEAHALGPERPPPIFPSPLWFSPKKSESLQ